MLSTQLQDLNRRLGKSGLWRLAVLFPITLSWWWSCCCTQKGSGISMSESSFQVTVWTILCLYQEMGNLFVFSKEVLWNFHQQNYSGKCLLSLGFLERSNERTQLQLNILCCLKRGQYSFSSMRWVQSVCFMLCLQHQQPLSETYCKDFSLNYQPLANHWPLLWVSNLILSSLQTLLHQITIVQCLLQVVWHFPHSRGDLRFCPPHLWEGGWSIAAWLAVAFCQAAIPCNLQWVLGGGIWSLLFEPCLSSASASYPGHSYPYFELQTNIW